MRTKQTAKWDLQIAEKIFQTHVTSCLQAPFELQIVYRTINEQIQNIAQKKDTLCRRMYNYK